MLKTLRFLLALAAALLIMLAIRAFAFTICTVEGEGLSPLFCSGDRVLVNRWSYGLRVGSDEGLFGYTRIARQPVERGDIVAFTVPGDTATLPFGFRTGILLARCKAVPGDTVRTNKGTLLIPGLKTCADHNYYWLESINQQNPIDSRHLGFISEKQIIGSVVTVLYNRHNIRLVP
jgi:signal peptidase I